MTDQQQGAERIEGEFVYAEVSGYHWGFWRKDDNKLIFGSNIRRLNRVDAERCLQRYDATARHFIAAGREAEREELVERLDKVALQAHAQELYDFLREIKAQHSTQGEAK